MGTEPLFQKHYYSRDDFVDGTTVFHRLCQEHIQPGSRILEFGAGPENATSAALAMMGTLYGVDVSAEVLTNSKLHESSVFDGKRTSFAECSFDACVSNYVLEHVEDPRAHFCEVARILRPGGVYVFRTPNLHHYVALISAMLPHSLHVRIANRMRNLGEGAQDPYPTVYRANTRRDVARLARECRLEVEHLILIEKEPVYGSASPMLFYPMMGYERLVNASHVFAGLRANILGVMRKSLAS